MAINNYYNEFLATLLQQSFGKDKYKPVKIQEISVGDLVLIKDPLMKCIDFPIGIVKNVVVNDLEEVTEVEVRKGNTGEVVRRHVTSLVPYMRAVDPPSKTDQIKDHAKSTDPPNSTDETSRSASRYNLRSFVRRRVR